MHGREPTAMPFSTEALRANLLRLENEWEAYQTARDRDAVYGYLSLVFELVSWWAQEGRAVDRAHRSRIEDGPSNPPKRNRSRREAKWDLKTLYLIWRRPRVWCRQTRRSCSVF